MTSPYIHSLPFFFLVFMILRTLFLCTFISSYTHARVLTSQRLNNTSISAIFVFGDSTVDPGNNNYIAGTTTKSNFPPYGKDFVNQMATGRFTNGRLVTDFIASYVGLKETIPPYLDPSLDITELMTGVSFASAGSGYDPLTPIISSVISMQRQVEYFREFRARIEHFMGKEKTENLISNAVFLVSAGTNDFVLNYFGAGVAIRRTTYPTVSSYQQFLMQYIENFIQDLSNEGARKIVVVSLPPMGCLPEVITLNTVDAFHDRKCIENLSSVARRHNDIIQNKLKSMQNGPSKIYYADIYQPLSDMIQSPRNVGFDEVNMGCCGTGYFESSALCNWKSPLCKDASKYVFWDAVHPTERAYRLIFDSLRPIVHLVING